MNYKDTYNFLNLFRNEDEKVVIGLLHENPNVKNKGNFKGVKHFEVPLKLLNKPFTDWEAYGYNSRYFINHHNNKLGKAVYFIVNPGGTKNKDINEIRSWFIDVDYGKIKVEFADENKANRKIKELEQTNEFLSLEIEKYESKKYGLKYIVKGVRNQESVKEYKEKFLRRFKRELTGATVVETYSGYHCYWVAREAKKSNFKMIQRALIKKFGSDTQIIKEANLMRIPGFFHQKYNEKFLIRIVGWSDESFTEEELISSLSLKTKERQTKGFAKQKVNERVSYSSEIKRPVTAIRKLQKSDMIFKNVIPFGSVENVTFKEALEKVLDKPISAFVESPVMTKGENIHCPFHNDSKPSGTVYHSDLDEEVYYCHACEVGTRNVVGLYMLHTGKGWRKSVEDLSKIIGVKVIETEFEREQFQKYRDNRTYLEQDLETLLPNTAKWIEKYGRRMYLRYFNDKGETKVLKEEFKYKDQNVFFISYRQIAKEMGKTNMQSVQNSIVLMNLLGFIERVPEEYIPDELRIRAEKERKILQGEFNQQGEKGKRRAKAVRLINFYIVNNWSDNAYNIEKIAQILILKKYSITKHNNKIAIENLLGLEHANRVFPDKRIVPRRFKHVSEKLELYIEKDIKEKGYSIGEEILRNKIRVKDKKGKMKTVTLKEKENIFKRSILINKRFKIKKIRSDKKKKELNFTKKTPKTIHVIQSN